MTRSRHKTVLQPKEPVLPPTLEATTFPAAQIEPGGHYTGLELTDWQAANQSGEAVTFDSLLLTKPNLAGSRLPRGYWLDVVVRHGDLSNANWGHASLNRVRLQECRLTGFRVNEAQMRDVLFQACKADLAQFRFAKCRAVRFEGCDLREADFANADLRDASFAQCDLRGANFTGAKLDGTDLRGSQLDDLQLRPTDMAGMIIDPHQAVGMAPLFAALLGVTVAGD